MSESDPGIDFRRLAIPIHLTTFLLAAAQDAASPFIVLAAQDSGASVAVAAMIFALRGLAATLFNIPAGSLIARLGERFGMYAGPVALIAGSAGLVVARNVWVLGLAVILLGIGWSSWKLARMSYITAVIPDDQRGRLLSNLGGITRIGQAVGPIMAVGALAVSGVDGVFMLNVVLGTFAIAALRWLSFLPAVPPVGTSSEGSAYVPVIKEHRQVLGTVGMTVLLIAALRQARPVAIPLWGSHIGLDVEAIGSIFLATALLEMLLFYPAGRLIDRSGRKDAVVRCALCFAATFILVPLTSSLESLLAISLIAAVGNGLATGIVLVLGSDVSPHEGRARFLAVFSLMADAGSTVGPLAFSVAGAIASLQGALLCLGLAGAATALFAILRVPETGPSGLPAA